MQISVTNASTKTSIAIITSLLALSDPGSRRIKGLYRDPKRVLPSFRRNSSFVVVHGDVSSLETLDFSGSEVVLASLPPIIDGNDDILQVTESRCKNIKQAVENAGTVRRLVLLSSIGAEFDHGTGELQTNHTSEKVLLTTAVPEIIVARCAYFMENWTASLNGLKSFAPSFYSTISPADYTIPMIAVKDIGAQLANSLVGPMPGTSPYIYDLWGPKDYSPFDVKVAFSEAMQQDVQVRIVEQKDLPRFFGQVFPPHIAEKFVEMTRSFLPGGIGAMDSKLRDRRPVIRGQVELKEVTSEAGRGLLAIEFVEPQDVGITINESQFAICVRVCQQEMPSNTGFLVHHIGPMKEGYETRNGFWIGGGHIDSSIMRLVTKMVVDLEEGSAQDLLVHCADEMNLLANFLVEGRT